MRDSDRDEKVVMVATQLINAVRSRQTINPKTVLGFYATILGIMLTATIVIVSVLAKTGKQLNLIPWLLAFSGMVFVLLVAGVFIITLVDPSKLMLTQVTGTEYAAIQHQVILGDSSAGERVELVAAMPGVDSTPEPLTVESFALTSGEDQDASNEPTYSGDES